MLMIRGRFFGLLASILIMPLLLSGVLFAGPYGRGGYGECTYGNCSITIATSGSVTLPVQPTATGAYTIDDDEVTVTTNSADGYTLSISSSSNDAASTSLVGPVPHVITPTTGTPASPTTLDDNQWGLRVDGSLGFGSGPTSTVTNATSSSLEFAGLTLLNSPAVIKTTNSAAPSGDTTSVWYGVQANTSIDAGTYTQTVVYTAVAL